jgi:hypothetical protein
MSELSERAVAREPVRPMPWASGGDTAGAVQFSPGAAHLPSAPPI